MDRSEAQALIEDVGNDRAAAFARDMAARGVEPEHWRAVAADVAQLTAEPLDHTGMSPGALRSLAVVSAAVLTAAAAVVALWAS